MKYYLCGPIDTAGHKEQNIANFKQAAEELRSVFGLDIISPIEANPERPDWEYLEYLKADIHKMLECESIILLDGWPQSLGARNELKIALELDMDVYFYSLNNKHLMNMNFPPDSDITED